MRPARMAAFSGVSVSSTTTISEFMFCRRNGKFSLPNFRYTNSMARPSVTTGATAKPAHMPFVPHNIEPAIGSST